MSITGKLKLDEKTFDTLLPEKIRTKSKRFFTPANIAIQAAIWLSGDDQRKVLDIGAGVGKFCLFGAHYTKSDFVGIEIRPHLVKIAQEMFNAFEIKNAKVVHGNITDFEFAEYKAFYLYNPFHENIVPFFRMDDSVLLSQDFYCIYMQHTKAQLALAPTGTRLVTYYGNNFEVPSSYKVAEEFNDGEIKYWIKEK